MFALRGKWCCAIAQWCMLFDQREKSYLFFSLFSLISSLEKSRGRFREKWRVKREKWKVQKEKAAYATFLFGCGGGIWTSRPPGYEPDELPSCSTPRYEILGTLWCRWPGSNRYDTFVSRDFKSRASACSATPANPRAFCFLAVSICHYIISHLLCQPFLAKYYLFINTLLQLCIKCDIMYLCPPFLPKSGCFV